jgi:hypothetical protein
MKNKITASNDDQLFNFERFPFEGIVELPWD